MYQFSQEGGVLRPQALHSSQVPGVLLVIAWLGQLGVKSLVRSGWVAMVTWSIPKAKNVILDDWIPSQNLFLFIFTLNIFIFASWKAPNIFIFGDNLKPKYIHIHIKPRRYSYSVKICNPNIFIFAFGKDFKPEYIHIQWKFGTRIYSYSFKILIFVQHCPQFKKISGVGMLKMISLPRSGDL